MDDLNGDGKVTVADAKYLAAVADQVESQYPELTGGIGVYRATGVHGPFVHVDTGDRRALVAENRRGRGQGGESERRGGSASCAVRFPLTCLACRCFYCLQGAVGSGFGLSTTRR